MKPNLPASLLFLLCHSALAQTDDLPPKLTYTRQLSLSQNEALPERSPSESPRIPEHPSENEIASVPDGKNEDLPVVTLSGTENARPIDLTRKTSSLWDRIRHGFSMPNLNEALVYQHQQAFQNRPEGLRRMVDRSKRYMFHIVEEIERRGMPMELALLPMVESAYNPMAESPARASGLWQFIPSTGRNFNLMQNGWQDQRRDIIASTSAALEYLQYIYDMHGDWFLALASYNWGEGAVGRAVAKNRAKGLPTDYVNLTMPAETRNYVPKLQALKNILSNPRLTASLDLPDIPNAPYFATLTQEAPIDVKVAAKLAEVPVDEFVALNPSHKRPVIQPDTPIVLPINKLETFQSNLERHQQEEKPLSHWRVYTLRPGDKLDSIARNFGMSLSELKTINQIGKNFRVEPGLSLLVQNRGEPENEGSPVPHSIGNIRLPAADPFNATSPTPEARSRTSLSKKTPSSKKKVAAKKSRNNK